MADIEQGDTVQITEAVAAFLDAARYEYGYSIQTVRAYSKDLQQLNTFVSEQGVQEVAQLDLEFLRAWLWWLQNPQKTNQNSSKKYSKPLASSTLARKIATLKSFGRYLERMDLVAINPAARLKTPKTGATLPKVLTVQQMLQLLTELQRQATSADPIAVRNVALIELLYATGMRVSELCSLPMTGLDLQQMQVRVHGKGNAERVMPIGTPATNALRTYLNGARAQLLARSANKGVAAATQLVFLGARGGQLAPASVYKLVASILPAAVGVAGPHIFRHTAATHMLDGGAEIRVVQDLLGHASLRSTQVYTHVSAKRLEAAFKNAHPRA